jgi:hypothetical protein
MGNINYNGKSAVNIIALSKGELFNIELKVEFFKKALFKYFIRQESETEFRRFR